MKAIEYTIRKNTKASTIIKCVTELVEGDTLHIGKSCSQEQVDVAMTHAVAGVVVVDHRDIAVPEGGLAFGPDKALTGKHPLTEERVQSLNNHFLVMEGAAVAVEAKQTIKEKVENTMTNVKDKVVAGKDAVVGKVADIKGMTFKGAVGSTWSGIKKGFGHVGTFFKKHMGTMAITAGSVVVAGAVTTGATAAVAVGAGVAATILLAQALIQKKKESRNTMVTLSVVAGTAVAVPFAFYALAFAGVAVTTFGAIAPYAIIVA